MNFVQKGGHCMGSFLRRTWAEKIRDLPYEDIVGRSLWKQRSKSFKIVVWKNIW